MAVTRTSDLAKARKARLELETRSGAYPTPTGSTGGRPSRGANLTPAVKKPAPAATPTDREIYESDEEFGFRTPRKRKGM